MLSPANDVQHVESEDCPCGPRAEPVKREDGSVDWVYVHHSLDGRESTEPTARRMPTWGPFNPNGDLVTCSYCGHIYSIVTDNAECPHE